MIPGLGKMPSPGTRGASAPGVPPHGGVSLRVGLGSSVHHDECSGLGMTPWSLSVGTSTPFPAPSHSPLCGWLGGQCKRRALSQPHPTRHSAGGLGPGVREGRARQQEGCSASGLGKWPAPPPRAGPCSAAVGTRPWRRDSRVEHPSLSVLCGAQGQVGVQRLPKVAQGLEPGRVGVSRDPAWANLARDSPTARSGQPRDPLGCVLTAGFSSSSYCESGPGFR